MTSAAYREKREQLGLTQEELAERVGVHRVTIAKREAGAPINREAELALRAIAAEIRAQYGSRGRRLAGPGL